MDARRKISKRSALLLLCAGGAVAMTGWGLNLSFRLGWLPFGVMLPSLLMALAGSLVMMLAMFLAPIGRRS